MNSQKLTSKFHRRRRRAMTFVEMIISTSLFGFIGIAVSYLVLAAARTSYDSTQQMRAESKIRLILDNIRREILVGQFLRVSVQDSGNTVVFYDPNEDVTSDFRYTPDTKILVYREDIDSGGATRTFKEVDDVVFAFVDANQTTLSFTVTINTRDSRGNTLPITISDQIFFRNKPQTT